MATRKIIEAEIGDLAGLGGIVTTYKEIAATRITRTRNSVLKSHTFLTEINEMFFQVKTSYRQEVARFTNQKKLKDPSKISFIKHNGKTVAVYLSSNTGLYGDIVKRTFDLFSKEARGTGYDIAVMGRLGLRLVEESNFPPPYAYFDFPDQRMDDQKLREIASYLIKYEKVVVFYEQFQTLVNQVPVVSDISGNSLSAAQTTSAPALKYLFEPSLEKVLQFFEKEIFAQVFEQTIRDSQLAKFASRLVTLDAASENIKKRLDRIVFEAVRLSHREKNKKQSQTFSSMNLWG